MGARRRVAAAVQPVVPRRQVVRGVRRWAEGPGARRRVAGPDVQQADAAARDGPAVSAAVRSDRRVAAREPGRVVLERLSTARGAMTVPACKPALSRRALSRPSVFEASVASSPLRRTACAVMYRRAHSHPRIQAAAWQLLVKNAGRRNFQTCAEQNRSARSRVRCNRSQEKGSLTISSESCRES